MDNLLQSLGLGGLFGGSSFFPISIQQQMAPLGQHSRPDLICIHQNCPICKERYDNQIKLWQEQEELKKKKKADYIKRCEEYMKKFRVVK